MSVNIFPNTVAGQNNAIAIPGPKNIYFTGNEFVVKSGADYEPPKQQTQTEIDIISANSYAKLTALKGMSPAQVQQWVSNNVTTLAQAQDAIATLAIAVSILARNL